MSQDKHYETKVSSLETKSQEIEEMLSIMEGENKPSYIQLTICNKLLADYNGSDEQFRSYMNRYFVLERK